MPDFSVFLRGSTASITVTADSMEILGNPPTIRFSTDKHTVALFPMDAIYGAGLGNYTRPRPSPEQSQA